ncbi:Helicase conserved C-terminal domain-containing protein [Lachnospiraceae bacterium XBB2008]|nr:Helicase conserved C-terminal domain-containing protein [Lachnospiraceae bacterium XBB2008]
MNNKTIIDGQISITDYMNMSYSVDLSMDWDNVFDQEVSDAGVHADSIPDALILSLTTLGKVDIEYMASVTGEDCKTVINALKGAIFQNPDTWDECIYKGWETADEYLSGNLKRKWKAAKVADQKYSGHFKDNLKAIEKVLPPTVASTDIYVTLGSPWVPADIIDDFIEHLLGNALGWWVDIQSASRIKKYWKTRHDEMTGTWEIPDKSRYHHNVAVSKTYGTSRIEALHIIERTLNMKTISVTDEVDCPTNKSGKKRVINKAETVAALEKQRIIKEEFQKWIWDDKERKERLELIFENKYSCVRRRIYDGSFLTFPTMSPDVNLYPYQKDAVARIIFSDNTLLAHDVGAGKTYVMIAAGQELRRMGLSAKNMYVVPNNIVGQWKNIFLSMYPDANLLCVDPKSFKPDKREQVLRDMRDGTYDGIIIAYSCFEQIPLSRDYHLEDLCQKREETRKRFGHREKDTPGLRKKYDNLNDAVKELENTPDDSAVSVFFDDLKVNRLFVDEAHNFKNVPLETKISNVLGISGAGSKKCREMLDKVHLVQKENGGKGVVFATGTPITNSISDAYIMQLYLQSGELAMMDLQTFDSWVGMFAERTTEFEIDVDTSTYRLATRFAKFHNLPELTSLFALIADFHLTDVADGIPDHDGYIDEMVAKTPEFEAYLKTISERADDVRHGAVRRKDDNMLKITTDGRKAALDIRLVDPQAPFSIHSKVSHCAKNVADIFYRTLQDKSTQLVFCDISTPKAGFNIYDELKELLLDQGVPAEQIAFIHDALTEGRRSELFKKVREGKIRVLIGSTFKLGLGVNVQDRLIAVHHIDVPWRPADMVQREGRILRQGNVNPKVEIYRYITEGSFDAYSWQLLETKQRFITDLLSGSVEIRSGGDIDDTVLNYAEVKALAVGNSLVKERVKAANELSRYQALQRKTVDARVQMEKELTEIPGKISHQKELVDACMYDALFCAGRVGGGQPEPVTTTEKEQEAEYRRQLRELITNAVANNIFEEKERVLTKYRGFEIVLPANMTPEKPYIWLERTGRYYVELSHSDIGNLVRIDNRLDTMEDHLDELRAGLSRLETRGAELAAELDKKESYTDQIEHHMNLIEDLDRKLGVNKK